MGKIEKEYRDLIANENEIIGVDLSSLEELEKSMNDYHSMVNNGITKSRGYNLLTIDCSIPIFEFNRA